MWQQRYLHVKYSTNLSNTEFLQGIPFKNTWLAKNYHRKPGRMSHRNTSARLRSKMKAAVEGKMHEHWQQTYQQSRWSHWWSLFSCLVLSRTRSGENDSSVPVPGSCYEASIYHTSISPTPPLPSSWYCKGWWTVTQELCLPHERQWTGWCTHPSLHSSFGPEVFANDPLYSQLFSDKTKQRTKNLPWMIISYKPPSTVR
jgi:hypothetical protein